MGISSCLAVLFFEDVELTSEWKYCVFTLSTPSKDVTIEGTTASSGRFYIDYVTFIAENTNDAIGAYTFAADFLNSTNDGCSAGTGIDSTTWSTLSSSWSSLNSNYSNAQTYFLNKTASESGSAIEEALARYDNIIANYGYNNFLNRSSSGVKLGVLIQNNNTNTIAIIVIISLVSVTAIGGYFFIKRREEN